ncbi:glutamate receptor 2.8-like [Phragmites australis]|uniref:glutamate receptor 2.8-like n=1 Tax=Phragmites australis TaxID=29695 RepID=UPI002D79EAF2|nr:glutamate receptor 2.8-like [Phragmites australis]
MIAVPQKHGFNDFVKCAIHIFNTSMKKLQHPRNYEFCAFNGTYDELVGNVSSRVFDGAVGDVTITAHRARLADFTMPYAPSSVSLLVLADNDSKPPIQWIFVKPLTKELWLTTVGFFFFTGFVLWMIERPRNPEYQGSSLTQVSTASYFTFSTLTFSHGHIIRSPMSKIVVVIWCFAVLLLVQSYTANLSSMLTAKRLRPWVRDLNQLVRNRKYIGYQQGGFMYHVLRKEGVGDDRLRPYGNQTEYADALRNGSVAAIADEIPYLSYFLSHTQQNKKFEIIGHLYTTPGFGFVFPRGSPLVHNLSVAILGLAAGNHISRMEHNLFGSAAPSTGDGSPVGDSTPLTLRSFSGLFLISGCVSASMLLISITRSVYVKYTRVTGSESQSANGNGGTLHLGEPSALHIDMGDSSVPDHCHHEIRDNDSEGAPGGSVSTGDEEAGPMQNGMYNCTVPADRVQIEMSSTGQGVDRAL